MQTQVQFQVNPQAGFVTIELHPWASNDACVNLHSSPGGSCVDTLTLELFVTQIHQ